MYTPPGYEEGVVGFLVLYKTSVTSEPTKIGEQWMGSTLQRQRVRMYVVVARDRNTSLFSLTHLFNKSPPDLLESSSSSGYVVITRRVV